MEKTLFLKHLRDCAAKTHEGTLLVVTNNLRPPFHYYVLLNQSFDGNPLADGERILSDLKARGGEKVGPMTDTDVIDLLWRDGVVPEWIDVTPYTSDATGTYFQLRCCGRFAAEERLLYHLKEGYPPFHRFGPMIPPDWESVEKSGRFDLHWHLRRTSAK
jgi:hypothetical protein